MTFNISPETVLNIINIIYNLTLILCILILIMIVGIILFLSICYPILLTRSLVEELIYSYHRGFRSLECISWITLILVLILIFYYDLLYDLYSNFIALQPSISPKETGWFQNLIDFIYDSKK